MSNYNNEELILLTQRIAELAKMLRAYTEAVAEICDEETFQRIEAEYQLRKESQE